MSIQLIKHFKNPIVYAFINVITGCIYGVFYNYVIENYINNVYDYRQRLTYTPMSTETWCLYIFLVGVPMLFLRRFKHFATVFSLFVYIFAYIPFLHKLFTNYFVSGYSFTISYLVVFVLSMCIFFITDKTYILKKLFTKTRNKVSFRTFEVICAFLYLLMLSANIGNIRFVNFIEDSDLMYDYREESVGNLVYLISWMKHAIMPLLLVCYMQRKNYKKASLTFVGMTAIYTIDMSKITFITPFVIVFLYVIFSIIKERFIHSFYYILVFLLVLFSFFCMGNLENPFIYTVGAILIMRTMCIEGIELGTYLRFFEEMTNHPFTNYTHIGIIGQLTGAYPYTTSVGKVVTMGGANANGMFWLMDGIAAHGAYGCIIASILFVIFKATVNSIGVGYNKNILVIIFIFSISALMNVSIFTALFSCGYILFYIVFLFVDLRFLQKKNY